MATKRTAQIEAWHFLPDNRRMRFVRRTTVEAGKTYRVRGALAMCKHGLHASRQAIDALYYAPGPIVCRVTLGGTIIEDTDKLVASERTVLWMADATDTLRTFSRWCALEVAHLWDVPPIVRQYLATGDESIRDAAYSAADSAAWSAARSAAWSAADSAAWSAAGSAADSAARSAAGSAADSAAWSAAWSAARSAFNTKLETMLLQLAAQAMTIESGSV